jgi:isoquinoline 1-oxidoreductase beta subunit
VGPIINLSGEENRVQGSIIDNISMAWLQEITHDRGRIMQSNFNA